MFSDGDIVVFQVNDIKESALSQESQTIRGEIISSGPDRIMINNFDRLADPNARKNNEGQAIRQYRFDQIVNGKEGIEVVYSEVYI